MRYVSLGEVPPKRHAQVWRQNGSRRLLTEEVLGYEGFSGNETILYHLHSPCRIAEVGAFTPTVREEWVPEAHVHRLADANGAPSGGDPVGGRRLLMFNDDLEVSIAKPTEAMTRFHRNGEGDEVIYVHRGSGKLRTVFGPVTFRERDYLVIPRGTTYRFEPDPGVEQFWVCMHTPGEIETPNRYRNRYGQLLEHAPYSQRDFHGPAQMETHDEAGEFELTVRVRGGVQSYLLDRHPFDVVGWDGYVFPYTFNADDFEPRAGRFHLPPPAHQTFQGLNFVICTFAPRMLDWDPQAVPIPYHHSNIQSEEVMFYADGDYAARKGVEVGCLTLHPSGLPHGPQPGTVEKALGATSTNELAVMWDTFKPLKLAALWRDNDKPEYAYSWNPDREATPRA
ncbi:Homogentisate 1,2-dioxygenase [Baekduia alba]|uniref:homogentisate 1,2-dioxygenase n=1 Tax=Baekduia alba TaxID=2997333 RepID=UPI002341256B|nr:homogentisate 1,2-dioxygenase [Baekduia alba]WCB93042.1 Homogentisate 1,2-dioxygenase [Baekduia alba]